MANLLTSCITSLYGNLVGADYLGNRYYEHKRTYRNNVKKRWVVYKKFDEASLVPPNYHAWLHYTSNDFPAEDTIENYAWQRRHAPNLSGTKFAYKPQSMQHKDGQQMLRPPATGDYQAWKP